MTRDITESTASQFDSTSSTGSAMDPVLTVGHSPKNRILGYFIDFVTAGLEILLGARLILLLFGLGATGSVANIVTTFSQPFVMPFEGLLSDSTHGAMNGGKMESATILSMIAVGLLGYGVRQLLDVIESKTVIEYER